MLRMGLGTHVVPSTDVVTTSDSDIDSGNRGLEGADDYGSRDTPVPGVMNTEVSATG